MFKPTEYDVLEELKFGDQKNPGTWLRLEKSQTGRVVIRIYSGAGKNRYWNVMYRYNVEQNWESWKKIHATKTTVQTTKPKNKRSVRKTNDVRRTKKVSSKKS